MIYIYIILIDLLHIWSYLSWEFQPLIRYRCGFVDLLVAPKISIHLEITSGSLPGFSCGMKQMTNCKGLVGIWTYSTTVYIIYIYYIQCIYIHIQPLWNTYYILYTYYIYIYIQYIIIHILCTYICNGSIHTHIYIYTCIHSIVSYLFCGWHHSYGKLPSDSSMICLNNMVMFPSTKKSRG
jgi:hypothetical protein